MKVGQRKIFLFLVSVIVILTSGPSFAAENRFDAFGFSQYLPEQSLSNPTAKTVGKNKIKLGIDWTYEWRNLRLEKNRSHNQREVLNDLFSLTPGFRLGFTSFWDAGFSLPLHLSYRFGEPSAAANVTSGWKGPSIGDMNFFTQLKALNMSIDGMDLRLAVLAELTAPTGNGGRFLGNKTATGGGRIIFDIEPTDRLFINISAGAIARKKAEINDISFGSQFLLSSTAGWRFSDSISGVAEFNSKTPFSKFFSEKTTSLISFLAGVRWQPQNIKNFVVKGGASASVFYGTGAPAASTDAGISYTLAMKEWDRPKVNRMYEYEKRPVKLHTAEISLGNNGTEMDDNSRGELDNIANAVSKFDKNTNVTILACSNKPFNKKTLEEIPAQKLTIWQKFFGPKIQNVWNAYDIYTTRLENTVAQTVKKYILGQLPPAKTKKVKWIINPKNRYECELNPLSEKQHATIIVEGIE